MPVNHINFTLLFKQHYTNKIIYATDGLMNLAGDEYATDCTIDSEIVESNYHAMTFGVTGKGKLNGIYTVHITYITNGENKIKVTKTPFDGKEYELNAANYTIEWIRDKIFYEKDDPIWDTLGYPEDDE